MAGLEARLGRALRFGDALHADAGAPLRTLFGIEHRLEHRIVAGIVLRAEALGHETSPPARYTEATLTKALEERGIGRPSTYAATVGTIQDRGYVRTRGSALIPTWLAFAVTNLLETHFPSLVDYDFTASMEEGLDRIAAGDEERAAWLTRFYFGDEGESAEGLKQLVDDLGDIDARGISTIPIGEGLVVRVGRYGPYVEEEVPNGIDPATGEVKEGFDPEKVGEKPRRPQPLGQRDECDLRLDPRQRLQVVDRARQADLLTQHRSQA